VEEKPLCCINLPGHTVGSEILRFLAEYLVRKRQTGETVKVCIDGAASMTGYHLGVVSKIKELTHKNVVYSLCNPSGAFSCNETICCFELVKTVNEIRN